MGWRQQTLGWASLALLVACPTPPASAFHDGGVGACDGCHDLHGSGAESPGLLRYGDASSTCLRCHAEAGAPQNVLSGDGSSFTAGGDFYWLGRSYSWTEDDWVRTSPGDSHGHNVVAVDFQLLADERHATAPGGTYRSANLSCVSCHDPHGPWTEEGAGSLPVGQSGSYAGPPPEGAAAGNYRLLGGRGYDSAGTLFTNDAPVAVAPSSWPETDDNHVDYGSGMSEWCANCHTSMGEGAKAQHVAGKTALFSAETAEAYDAYLGTGRFSGKTQSSYLALVPFERGVADPRALSPQSTRGPEAGTSNVMCLSCHRVHASAFRSIGRWDLNSTFLADSHPAVGDEGAGARDAGNSYYGRDIRAELGPFQRSLCNKCHVAD